VIFTFWIEDLYPCGPMTFPTSPKTYSLIPSETGFCQSIGCFGQWAEKLMVFAHLYFLVTSQPIQNISKRDLEHEKLQKPYGLSVFLQVGPAEPLSSIRNQAT
jgi:hypothetical protein